MTSIATPCRALGRQRTAQCRNYPGCWCITSVPVDHASAFRSVLAPLGLSEAHQDLAFQMYRWLVLNIDHGLSNAWLGRATRLPAEHRARVLAHLQSLGIVQQNLRGRWTVTRCAPLTGGGAL
jgi:hypothetical protein